MATSDGAREWTWPEIFARLGRRWWLLVICVAVGGGAAYGLAAQQPSKYAATVSVYVSGPSGSLVSSEQVASYAAIARSTPVVQGAIAALGIKDSAATIEGELSSDVTAGTTLISITVVDRSATRAALIANATGASLRKVVQGLRNNARIVTVQHASTPRSPSSPKDAKDVGIGLAIGLLVGIFLAIVRRRPDPPPPPPVEMQTKSESAEPAVR